MRLLKSVRLLARIVQPHPLTGSCESARPGRRIELYCTGRAIKWVAEPSEGLVTWLESYIEELAYTCWNMRLGHIKLISCFLDSVNTKIGSVGSLQPARIKLEHLTDHTAASTTPLATNRKPQAWSAHHNSISYWAVQDVGFLGGFSWVGKK